MQQEQDLCVALLKRWALGLACVIILRLGDGAPSECDHGPCICQGVDIYNDRDYLEARNCSVVEGRLVIFPSIKLTSFSNKDLEFPFLEDIHDYLTLYGAHDFKFRFPKLVIIRGKRPKHNYALLISKLVNTQVFMPSLQIVRVGIGIHDNRNLCPAKMIDWNAIVSSGETWVYKNTELSSCPTCNSSCPRDPEGNLLCWDGSTCQKILQCPGNCPETAAGCIGKECCDPECIGGCVNNSTRGCLACKNYRHNGDCLKSCPDGLVPYNHRCIVTREECLDVRPTLPRIAQDELIPLTKFFDHSCTRDVCPVGYDTRCSPDKSNRTCQPCPGGRCNTICPGSNEDAVYSVESAMKFGGRCVIIDGSLKIHIRYDVVVEAMMEHMKSIEVITGFLKIYGSFPLTSLDFLPNLKEIRGLERDRFNRTLWIQDNRNLMRLWDWEDRAKRNITGIKINGTIFFHDNHRLCFSEIRKLAEQANLPSEVNDLQVMGIPMYSNGDLGNCYDEELIISPEGIKVFSKVIKLTWFRPQQSPKEDILSYVISYREAPPGQNTSMDDIPCAERSWKYVDIEADQGMNANITQLITQLRPATRYAVYISTLMLNPSKGAVSKMHYITTLPGIPSPPRQVKVLPNGTHALNVAWKSPLHENGVVTSYKIEVIKIQQSLSRRRVCDEMSPKNQEFIKDREAIIKTQKNIITDWNEKDAVEDYDIQSALKDHIGILEDHKCRDEPDQCTSICSNPDISSSSSLDDQRIQLLDQFGTGYVPTPFAISPSQPILCCPLFPSPNAPLSQLLVQTSGCGAELCYTA
ncbi:unnamed protein product [Cyprideis torosa]|uniref:receptor protein-tyrosine kinase n=1 Tax=Cyprideis torosa TaxID=163714 RepID=A0A7R8WBN4_9CRUS|nr:unnamed protein product [Cyprideis torosa]CAG0886522.1 unnamed protein product [Cyprideis torosa]